MGEPCRRRAVWAAQAEAVKQAVLSKEIQREQNEARNDADAKTDALPEEVDHGGRTGRNHHETISARADEVGWKPPAPVEGKANPDKPTAKKGKVVCPKCGQEGRQGMWSHIKYCRGG